MAAPQSAPPGTSSTPPPASDRQWLWWLAAAVFIAICIPAAVAVGMSTVRWTDAAPTAGSGPSWVSTQAVKGTSRDGAPVQMRVALDAPDAETRAFVQRSGQQVAIVMQLGIAAHDSRRANGAQRVERLSAALRQRLNTFLEANDVPPVRTLLIEDLVIGSP
jgi:hypothetical protein